MRRGLLCWPCSQRRNVGFGGAIGTVDSNLWFGGTGSVSFDTHPVSGSPAFADPPSDLHLTAVSARLNLGSGAVITLLTNDYDAVVPRPIGEGVDIGACE